MAKKRKKMYKRRRRISGVVDNLNIMDVLGAAAGGIGAKFLNKVVPDTLDKKLVSGGKILVGALLPMLVKGQGAGMAKAAGNGMVAIGAAELLNEMGVLGGMGDDDMLAVAIEGIEDVEFEDLTDDIGADIEGGGEVLGDDDIPVISGDDDIPVISGDDEY